MKRGEKEYISPPSMGIELMTIRSTIFHSTIEPPSPDRIYATSYLFWISYGLKNVTSAASNQYGLEVHMSAIYHKSNISLAHPSTLYSVWNEIIFPPNKTMAPLQI